MSKFKKVKLMKKVMSIAIVVILLMFISTNNIYAMVDSRLRVPISSDPDLIEDYNEIYGKDTSDTSNRLEHGLEYLIEMLKKKKVSYEKLKLYCYKLALSHVFEIEVNRIRELPNKDVSLNDIYIFTGNPLIPFEKIGADIVRFKERIDSLSASKAYEIYVKRLKTKFEGKKNIIERHPVYLFKITSHQVVREHFVLGATDPEAIDYLSYLTVTNRTKNIRASMVFGLLSSVTSDLLDKVDKVREIADFLYNEAEKSPAVNSKLKSNKRVRRSL